MYLPFLFVLGTVAQLVFSKQNYIICPDMNFEDFSGSLKQLWMFFMDGNHKTVTKNGPKPKKRIIFWRKNANQWLPLKPQNRKKNHQKTQNREKNAKKNAKPRKKSAKTAKPHEKSAETAKPHEKQTKNRKTANLWHPHARTSTMVMIWWHYW